MKIRLKTINEFLKYWPTDIKIDKRLIALVIDGKDIEAEVKYNHESHSCAIYIDDHIIFLPSKTYFVTKNTNFKKDQKVLVWDSGDSVKIKRYYSHYSNGLHYCFDGGATSWSSGSKKRPVNSGELSMSKYVFCWEYCEAYEDDSENDSCK